MTDFEKSLNERMDDASLSELMPGFDRDMEWNKLSNKLRPQKKRIFLPALSYAAAILFVVLVSWFLVVHNSLPKNSAVNNVATTKKVKVNAQPASPIIITPQHSIATVQKVNTVVTNPAKKQLRTVTIPNPIPVNDTNSLLAQDKSTDINLKQESDSSKTTPREPEQPAIAVIKQKRKHAINVLDIENEDRQFIINEAPEGRRLNPILSKMRCMDGFVTNDGAYPLQGVLKR